MNICRISQATRIDVPIEKGCIHNCDV